MFDFLWSDERGRYRRAEPPGPAASWLLDQFVASGRGENMPPGFVDV